MGEQHGQGQGRGTTQGARQGDNAGGKADPQRNLPHNKNQRGQDVGRAQGLVFAYDQPGVEVGCRSYERDK
jgi:hypothetical protein